MNLDKTLLSKFLNELFAGEDSFPLTDHTLASVIIHFDINSDTWKVDNEYRVWKKLAWTRSDEQRKLREAEWAKEKQSIELRKNAFYLLRRQLIKLRFEVDTATMVASEIISKNAVEAAKTFGVDISNLPILDKPFVMADENLADWIKI